MRNRKIICLAGPTGSGKSAIAAELGRRLGGVVINADSRQLYADFSIITARPGEEELALCPHLLYGFLDLRASMSAGAYARLAAPLIEEALGQGALPIVTGGSGLYFRALLQGLAGIPPVAEGIHARWLERCAALGSAALHAELLRLDPVCAARIHPHDKQRVTRALEVHEATGRPLSWWQGQGTARPAFDALYLGVDLGLEELTPRLDLRIERMLERGALREAARALEKCPEAEAPGWSGIGCAELRRVLTGELSLEEAALLWRKNTRAYAKRQLTWFRAEKEIRWHKTEEFRKI